MIHTITKKQAEELEQLVYSNMDIFYDIFFYNNNNHIHVTRNEYDDNFYQIAGEDDATDDINFTIEDMQIINANVTFDELFNDLKKWVKNK